MSPLSQLAPGAVFARDFRVMGLLAEGGMGAVYVAEQLSTGKRRALKIMLAELVTDPRARQRFELEARIASQIDSEHVVEVVGAGVDEQTQTPWLAMELLEGRDLSTVVREQGRLPREEVLVCFHQMGHALSIAHDKGIVHRDLKPENLFLALSRRQQMGVGPFTLKVLDFGIAKLTQESRATSHRTAAMGSPLWMAPEQTERAELTPRTDVWAMGLIAFYLLTGKMYWRSANQEETRLASVLTELLVTPLDPASVRAAQLGVMEPLPAGFDTWFGRCVARDPMYRFADARAAVGALGPGMSYRDPSGREASQPFVHPGSSPGVPRIAPTVPLAAMPLAAFPSAAVPSAQGAPGMMPGGPGSQQGGAPGMAPYGSAPGMMAPYGSAPGMVAPHGSTPGMMAPYGSAPGMVAPHGSTPGMMAPYGSAPGMVAAHGAPGSTAPHGSAQGMMHPAGAVPAGYGPHGPTGPAASSKFGVARLLAYTSAFVAALACTGGVTYAGLRGLQMLSHGGGNLPPPRPALTGLVQSDAGLLAIATPPGIPDAPVFDAPIPDAGVPRSAVDAGTRRTARRDPPPATPEFSWADGSVHVFRGTGRFANGIVCDFTLTLNRNGGALDGLFHWVVREVPESSGSTARVGQTIDEAVSGTWAAPACNIHTVGSAAGTSMNLRVAGDGRLSGRDDGGTRYSGRMTR